MKEGKSFEIIKIFEKIRNEIKIDSEKDERRFGKIYYRGMASRDWKFEPSAYRKDLKNSEDKIYFEALRKYPTAFSDCVLHIDYIRRMQHYAVPTRFIDVTTNPLIALWFASGIDQNIDGVVEVFILKNEESSKLQVKNNFSDIAEIISSLATFNREFKEELKKHTEYFKRKMVYQGFEEFVSHNKEDKQLLGLDDEKFKLKKKISIIKEFNTIPFVRRLTHEVSKNMNNFREEVDPRDLTKFYIFDCLLDNDRITAQNGSFIATAFPESFAKIQQEIEGKKVKEITSTKEFDLRENIEKNYLETLGAYYFRISIDCCEKDEIMKILDNFGINESFVYPELYSNDFKTNRLK
ncbi:MAG: FRG domain-containing protein [Streptococcaceae bacterium]|jgi:hypothetical protein|nr:FRG domain-containing protein [Streptococcaceae bacterium]